MDANRGRWYIVHCKPQKEAMAARALQDYLGVTTYLAEVERRVRGEAQRRPFFRGYIFACADLNEVKLSSINSTPGVIRLLEFGDQPRALEAEVMETIMRKLEELNEHGGIPLHPFKRGDKIVLQSGRFRSLEAIFLGPSKASDRVKVLLKLLGGAHEVDVEVDDLEPAPEPTVRVLERRSRGRGRPIKMADHD